MVYFWSLRLFACHNSDGYIILKEPHYFVAGAGISGMAVY